MNFYSHDYVAYKVLEKYNPLIAAGSHIPDFVPFVPNSVFTFDEIHESPEILYDYLLENNPEKTDLALAMMTHSVKFGADKFNNIPKWLNLNDDKREEIVNEIIDCSGIDHETASGSRLHNYLWVGTDVYLLKNEFDFISNAKNHHEKINRNEISKLLANCFQKDLSEVTRMANYMFDLINCETFNDIDGYVNTWKKIFEGRDSNENHDIEKSKKLFMKIYEMFEDDWENIFRKVINDVSIRMKIYV